MAVLFSWGVTSLIVPFFIGLGLYFRSEKDIKLAKTSFLLAAADAVGGTMMWGVKSQGSLAVVFVATGSLAVITVLAFRYADMKASPLPEPPRPAAPAPPKEAYEHSERPSASPKPNLGVTKPSASPGQKQIVVVVEGIQSLVVDLKLTFIPKDGAKLPQGNDSFMFLSTDLSKVQGGPGDFLLNLENNRNIRIQEDNKVVVTYHYTLPASSDLSGKPLKYLNLMDKISLVVPTSMDAAWAKTLVYGEVGVYVNGNLWGLVPSAANREVTQNSTVLTLPLSQFKRF